MAEDLQLIKVYIEKIIRIRESQNNPKLNWIQLKKIAFEVGVTEEEWNEVLNAYESYVQKGESFLHHDNWKDAIEEFQDAYKIYPIDQNVLIGLAFAYEKRYFEKRWPGDKKNGIFFAEKCLESDPDNHEAARIITHLKKAPLKAWISHQMQRRLIKYAIYLFILAGIYWYYQSNREKIHSSLSALWNPKTNATQKGEVFVLKNVLFDPGSTILNAQSQIALQELIKYLRENENVKGEIAGHTDNSGLTEQNQRISELRAKAVFDYLVSQGIQEQRLLYKGYGDKNPAFPNDTEFNRAKNRRIEFRVF